MYEWRWRGAKTSGLHNKRKKQKLGKKDRNKRTSRHKPNVPTRNCKNGNKYRTEETRKAEGRKHITYDIQELRANPKQLRMAAEEKEENELIERIVQQEAKEKKRATKEEE